MPHRTKIIVACLAALVVSCDSVSGIQIASCADACVKNGREMARATDKECVCVSRGVLDGGAQ